MGTKHYNQIIMKSCLWPSGLGYYMSLFWNVFWYWIHNTNNLYSNLIVRHNIIINYYKEVVCAPFGRWVREYKFSEIYSGAKFSVSTLQCQIVCFTLMVPECAWCLRSFWRTPDDYHIWILNSKCSIWNKFSVDIVQTCIGTSDGNGVWRVSGGCLDVSWGSLGVYCGLQRFII